MPRSFNFDLLQHRSSFWLEQFADECYLRTDLDAAAIIMVRFHVFVGAPLLPEVEFADGAEIGRSNVGVIELVPLLRYRHLTTLAALKMLATVLLKVLERFFRLRKIELTVWTRASVAGHQVHNQLAFGAQLLPTVGAIVDATGLRGRTGKLGAAAADV